MLSKYKEENEKNNKTENTVTNETL